MEHSSKLLAIHLKIFLNFFLKICVDLASSLFARNICGFLHTCQCLCVYESPANEPLKKEGKNMSLIMQRA